MAYHNNVVDSVKQTSNLEGKVLLLEDYAFDADLIKENVLSAFPKLSFYHAKNNIEFKHLLSEVTPDVVLLDLSLPDTSGIDALKNARHYHPEAAYIVVSGELTEYTAELCLQEGAFDWVPKDSLLRLELSIGNALRLGQSQREKTKLINEAELSESRIKSLFKKSGLAIIELRLPGLGKIVEEHNSPLASLKETSSKLRAIKTRIKTVQTTDAALKLFSIQEESDFLRFFEGWMKSDEVPLVEMLSECIFTQRQSVETEMIVTTASNDKKYLNLRMTYDHKFDHFAIGIIDHSSEKLSLQKAEQLMSELETKIVERTEELSSLNNSLKTEAIQRKKITAALRDNYLTMTDSIIAAKSIQQLMLPSAKELNESFSKHFICFQPKDIVSGDFYWFSRQGNKCWLAVADCVGHGVPGAFMSMISSKILNQIVVENETHDVSAILTRLDEYVIKEMKQHDHSTQVSTGMDITICAFDFDKNELQFAGAYHNLVASKNGEQKIFSGNRYPIGGTHNQSKEFKKHVIPFEKGDRFYLFTDGITDQFGGEKGKKYGRRRLYSLIDEGQSLDMHEQNMAVDEALLDWKRSEEQVDDMLLLSVEI